MLSVAEQRLPGSTSIYYINVEKKYQIFNVTFINQTLNF